MVSDREGRKILVVDDEPDLRELVKYNLSNEGFLVDEAGDGEEALAKLDSSNYDLVVLDLMLPGIQGTDICRHMRSEPSKKKVPIIMLTAKGEEIDKVIGLELGADDYMTKPFSPRELIARINAILRRTSDGTAEEHRTELVAGGLKIIPDEYKVYKDDREIELSHIEFRILLFLAERPGKVYSREQLLDFAWKGEAYVEPRTVDVHVRRLRTKIEGDPSKPRILMTKHSVGYYLEDRK